MSKDWGGWWNRRVDAWDQLGPVPYWTLVGVLTVAVLAIAAAIAVSS